jgi:release factor glutamine methyltransferase
MTIGEAHARAAQVLAVALELNRGEAHARARLLLDWATGRRYAHLLAPEQVLAPSEQAVFEASLARAQNGEPLPYITGVQEFAGRAFEVGPGVLIPRPETELLVETARKYLPQRAVQIADLGTGSGAIAVTLALEVPESRVLATDVSPDALEIAARNRARHGVQENVELVLSDDSWVKPLQERLFDVIVSNPPYIASAEIETLQIEVRTFEPRGALDGGADGLGPYRIFARELGKYLRPAGFVALELGAGQWRDLALLFEQSGWHVEPPIVDFAGIERVLVARPA